MRLLDYDYDLPKEMIAQEPVRPRSASRLMVVKDGEVRHKRFNDILDYFSEGDVLVVNETKVMKWKLRGKKSTGGEITIVITGTADGLYRIRVAGHRPRVGNHYIFEDSLEADVIEQRGEEFLVRFNKENVDELLQKVGELPTPFYVTEKLKDDSHYQTVYANEAGSVAAPTAGLHFTPELLEAIEKKGVKVVKVCLHVSFGTFLPVKDDSIVRHKMEPEFYSISEEAAETINNCSGRLFCVGTTSFKTLESACGDDGRVVAGSGWSELFIYPGVKLKSKVDYLITNFHLPKSTLILLVSAFSRREIILDAYEEAKREGYRFYSFGDAMLLERSPY